MLYDDNVLSPLSANMSQMKDLLNAEQSELFKFEAKVKHETDQLFICSASTGLARYEKMFALPVSAEEIQKRRNKIIAKLNTRSPATVANIKGVVEVITGKPCDIIEFYSDYMFSIKFQSDYGDYIKLLDDIKGAVDEIKPAHLGYKAIFLVPTTAPLYTAMHHTVATRISIAPYLPHDIAAPPAATSMGAFAKTGMRITIQAKQ